MGDLIPRRPRLNSSSGNANSLSYTELVSDMRAIASKFLCVLFHVHLLLNIEILDDDSDSLLECIIEKQAVYPQAIGGIFGT